MQKSFLANRSGGAHDPSGGVAVLAGDASGGVARPLPQGSVRASRPHAGRLRLLEAQHGRERAAAGVPAAHHGALAGADRTADRNLLGRQPAGGRAQLAQPFRTRYTREDILLLAEISNGHLYNLRRSRTYATHPTHAPIGVRRKARPEGYPGWNHVDLVYQADLDNVIGVYHINAVDEVTQYQITACVEHISENFTLPVLERLPESFPFCGARLPLRQRLRVRELPSGRAAGEAARDGVHQGAPVARQGQRPSGE